MAPRFDKNFFAQLIDRAKQAPDPPETVKTDKSGRPLTTRSPDPAACTRESQEVYGILNERVRQRLEEASVFDDPDHCDTIAALEAIIGTEIGCLKMVAKCLASRASIKLHGNADSPTIVPGSELAALVLLQKEMIHNLAAKLLIDAIRSVSDRVDAGEFDLDKLR